METHYPPYYRADSRLAPSQCETSLQSNAVSRWLEANIESALYDILSSNKRYAFINISFNKEYDGGYRPGI